jgi:uncharacterized protein YpbB
VLSQKAILSLVESLPATLKEFEHTKGIGKSTTHRYGNAILEMINSYCDNNKIERGKFVIPEVVIKVDTKIQSYNLYKAGKTITEIAAERNFATSTIDGHLAHFITEGKILVTELISVDKLKQIMDHLQKHPDMPNGDRKMALGETVSYSDLKAVSNHLLFINSNEVC